MLIGFGSLALEKLLSTFVFAQVVFAGFNITPYAGYVFIGEHFLSIAALILISTAFLYPVHKKHQISLRRLTYAQLLTVLAVFVICALIAFGFLGFVPNEFRARTVYALMEIILALILLFPIAVFIKTKELTSYNRQVAIAFLVYSVSPLVNIVNLTLYGGLHPRLVVFAHPFPFVAIALFLRVIFLKLVDKATLKEELHSTREMYLREKEVSSVKDEFVSTVSHELRTPITTIRLYLSLLLSGKFGKVNKKQAQTLQTIDNESLRLKNLISDILDLSRLENKKSVLNIKKVNLKNLINSCIYPHLLEGKSIEVSNKVPEYFVWVDPEKFKQVVTNFFTNAVKHTDEGGKIIFFLQEDGTDNFVLGIQDTGRGIAPEALPYLFDKFYQVEGHMDRRTGGLGLGLAIVKKLVELHKGEIEVTSQLGTGTTFKVKIPKNLEQDQ